jgi:hypothetical protein
VRRIFFHSIRKKPACIIHKRWEEAGGIGTSRFRPGESVGRTFPLRPGLLPSDFRKHTVGLEKTSSGPLSHLLLVDLSEIYE